MDGGFGKGADDGHEDRDGADVGAERAERDGYAVCHEGRGGDSIRFRSTVDCASRTGTGPAWSVYASQVGDTIAYKRSGH